nr:hypothetical protein NG677_01850 [Methylobacterium sp. OTU13CASTA1]
MSISTRRIFPVAGAEEMNQDSRAHAWGVKASFSLVCLIIVLSVASLVSVLIFLVIEAADRVIETYVLPILIEEDQGFFVDTHTDAS